MKKKLAFIIAFLLVNIQICLSQKINEELFVINLKGAKIYEKPTFDSKTVSVLELGKPIIVEKVIETKEEFKIGKGFSLKGKWIKSKRLKGYVFSSDFSLIEPKISITHGRLKSIDLKGEELKVEKEEKMIEAVDGTKYKKEFEYTFYTNATYVYSTLDGCFDHETRYKNLKLNEVYHQMLSDYRMALESSDFILPNFLKKTNNRVDFNSEGGANELHILLLKNGEIIVASYDCT
ncbi:hypothetical protein [Aureivirga marina]|uniref:hypothetical protein n=1 Tax=Aureivirga marina TaxID=1182451 RepID=UPI0018C9D919|nr:hypothetical protein [Aureivirga marina]